MRFRSSLSAALCFVALYGFGSTVAFAQNGPHLPVLGTAEAAQIVLPAQPKLPPRDYGTTHLTYVQVPAAAFTPIDSSTTWTTGNSAYHDQVLRTVTGSFVFFAAPVNLPNGAFIKYLELDECDDTGGSGFVQGALVASNGLGFANATGFLASDGSGCQYLSEDVSAKNFVVSNFSQHYWLVATVSSDPGHTTGFAGMVVGYQLQVSPAPATATFADVPTNYIYFRAIEALAHSGITSGCGGGNFCPNQAVTRGELAKFLANALGLYWLY